MLVAGSNWELHYSVSMWKSMYEQTIYRNLQWLVFTMIMSHNESFATIDRLHVSFIIRQQMQHATGAMCKRTIKNMNSNLRLFFIPGTIDRQCWPVKFTWNEMKRCCNYINFVITQLATLHTLLSVFASSNNDLWWPRVTWSLTNGKKCSVQLNNYVT